jgi:hypothetical protein
MGDDVLIPRVLAPIDDDQALRSVLVLHESDMTGTILGDAWVAEDDGIVGVRSLRLSLSNSPDPDQQA